jgi:hypothetical protein
MATMADTLGLHIAAEGITAVRLDTDTSDAPVVVLLGVDGPAAACLVAQDDGGAVLVGDAARRASGPVVDDPMERAAAGRIGALSAVINHVVGRAAMAGGSAPTCLAVVVPDDFGAAARDRVIEAGAAAGLKDTVAVPLMAAMAQSVAVDEVVAIAAGGAKVASLAAAPLVTREDLGETVKPRRTTVAPPVEVTSPVSVFTPDPEPELPTPAPARPAAQPVAAAPPSPVDATTAIRAAPVPETLRYEPPKRRVGAALILAVLLVGLIAAIAIGLLVFAGEDPSPATTEDPVTTTPPTATLPESATTVAPTTIDPLATTTTLDHTLTTTTTTEPPVTTTTPLPVASPGAVTLVETGLQIAHSEVVLFGQSDDTVMASLTAALGEPESDSGMKESAFCFGARNRFVRWGDLELVFTEEVLESGDASFSQWFADGHDDPEGLVTLSGVGVTATVGFLEATLGPSLQLVAAIPGDSTGLFAATNPGSGGLLNGTTSSREPEGVVISLWAGDSCNRIFT